MNLKNVKMSDELAETHKALSDELSYLYTKWNYWKRLYCKDDATVQLLEYAAGFFFDIYQEVLRDDMILSICRLTDHPSSNYRGNKKENMTFPRLIELLPINTESFKNTETALEKLKGKISTFREHRNRRIGHIDLATHKKQSDALLPNLTIKEMDSALSTMANLLNLVEFHYDLPQNNYKDGRSGEGTAENLIEFIQCEQQLQSYYNKKEFGDSEY